MIVAWLAFYLFSFMAIVGALNVIFQRNPVHSVLWLIFTFFNAAGLFVLLGAEFVAMILVVVYVGAVAVLFLFVVMMLDINVAVMREGFLRYLPVGALIGVVLLVELAVVYGGWTVAPQARKRCARRRRPTSQGLQHPGARPSALHQIRLSVSGLGRDPAGRHDRRDRADPSPPRRSAQAEDRRPGRTPRRGYA